jgi:hypothetical protein
MRNEVTEARCQMGNRGVRSFQTGRRAMATGVAAHLAPHAVDEALADESTTVMAERGSRRELTMQAKAKRAVDEPHVVAIPADAAAGHESFALRSLAEQIAQLQIQQEQIRRLLEQAERRSAVR